MNIKIHSYNKVVLDEKVIQNLRQLYVLFDLDELIFDRGVHSNCGETIILIKGKDCFGFIGGSGSSCGVIDLDKIELPLKKTKQKHIITKID